MILFVAENGLQAVQRKGKAQRWFEYAYKTEKKAPFRSVKMYRLALDSVLKKDKHLERAAVWRLLYLYEDLGLYQDAFLLFEKYPSYLRANTMKTRKIRNRLLNSFRKTRNISLQEAKDFVNVFRYLHQGNSEVDSLILELSTRTTGNDGLKDAIENDGLKDAIFQLLLRYKKHDMAKEILNYIVLEPKDYYLKLADIQLHAQLAHEAEQSLFEVLDLNKKLSQDEHLRFYYLYGRILRTQKKYEEAAEHFSMASSYGKKSRMQGLAAYCLYLANKPKEALELVRSQRLDPQSDMYLLQLVLRVEAGDKRASYRNRMIYQLRKLRPYIEAKSSKPSSHLASHALRILRTRS